MLTGKGPVPGCKRKEGRRVTVGYLVKWSLRRERQDETKEIETKLSSIYLT